MSTARTAFARAVHATQQLLLDAGVTGPHVFRSRARVIPKQQATAVVVRLHRAEAEPSMGQGAPAQWQTALAVECYARGGAEVDTVLDTLLADVAAALAADPTLGGVVGSLQPMGLSWDFDVDGEQTACATATYFLQQLAAPDFT